MNTIELSSALNTLPAVENVTKIIGIKDNNGSLINYLDLFKKTFQSTGDVVDDANKFSKSGIYRINNDYALNAPKILWTDLIVFSAGNAILQITYDKNSLVLYYRVNVVSPNEWSPWRKILGSIVE